MFSKSINPTRISSSHTTQPQLEVSQAALESRGAHPISLLILSIVGLVGYAQSSYTGLLTLVIAGVAVYELVKRLDQGLPLMQIAALLAVMQWNVGPWLAYNIDVPFDTYFMRVESNVYFSYAFPGTAGFVVGLLSAGASVRQRTLLIDVDRSQFFRLGITLTILGMVGGLGAQLLPSGLVFVCYLFSQCRYVAALYFVFSRHPLRWLFVVVSVVPLFTGTAENGMFHDLLLWMGILVCYVYALKSRKRWMSMALVIGGLFVAFTVQGIKGSYREKVWNGQEGSLANEIRDFWTRPNAVTDEATLSNSIIRINQGWIIAAIMQNVPNYEPYAMGETLKDAAVAALVPRLFSEDKTTAGGQVNYRRFTGLKLADTTSMGLSLLGEAYANVGPVVGVFLMLLFGGLLSLLHGSCLVYSIKNPTFYFWIPVIFCQTIKAETDLVTVLNHITKGSIVVFGLYWLFCIKLLPASRTR
jgi:hypothetical protein